MSRAWMPFYVGDYLRDTMHLTHMQHGMYILLILHYWEHGCLPHSTAGKARVARAPEATFRDHEATLAAFFEQPGWRHKRIDKELEKLENISIRRKIAGAKGGFRSSVERIKRAKQLPSRGVSNWSSNSLHNHKERKKEGEPLPPRSLASALPSGALASVAETQQAERPKEVWREKPVWALNRSELADYHAAKREKH